MGRNIIRQSQEYSYLRKSHEPLKTLDFSSDSSPLVMCGGGWCIDTNLQVRSKFKQICLRRGNLYEETQQFFFKCVTPVVLSNNKKWLWQVAGLVHGCGFLKRPVRGMFHQGEKPYAETICIVASS